MNDLILFGLAFFAVCKDFLVVAMENYEELQRHRGGWSHYITWWSFSRCSSHRFWDEYKLLNLSVAIKELLKMTLLTEN